MVTTQNVRQKQMVQVDLVQEQNCFLKSHSGLPTTSGTQVLHVSGTQGKAPIQFSR
jgi:hypothetical protein